MEDLRTVMTKISTESEPRKLKIEDSLRLYNLKTNDRFKSIRMILNSILR